MALSAMPYTEQNKKSIDTLNKSEKSLENTSLKQDIPSSFAMKVDAFDKNKNNNGISNDKIIQSKFQADSILAYGYKNNKSDLSYLQLQIFNNLPVQDQWLSNP